jgi:hypothetical protein
MKLLRRQKPAHRPFLSGKTALGRTWAYVVPFRVKNKNIIEKLIGCERQGVNISRPDSNGVISWGILQYNGTSTWAEFSQKSGIVGTPVNPPDAIRMTDWAIDHGYLGRWTCSRILGRGNREGDEHRLASCRWLVHGHPRSNPMNNKIA